MVWAVQLQQTKKHGKVRTTGTAGLRPDRYHGARCSLSRTKRLAIIDGGTLSFFRKYVAHTHTHTPISSSCSLHVTIIITRDRRRVC